MDGQTGEDRTPTPGPPGRRSTIELLSVGLGALIRTTDPCLPKAVLYQTELHRDVFCRITTTGKAPTRHCRRRPQATDPVPVDLDRRSGTGRGFGRWVQPDLQPAATAPSGRSVGRCGRTSHTASLPTGGAESGVRRDEKTQRGAFPTSFAMKLSNCLDGRRLRPRPAVGPPVSSPRSFRTSVGPLPFGGKDRK